MIIIRTIAMFIFGTDSCAVLGDFVDGLAHLLLRFGRDLTVLLPILRYRKNPWRISGE
jgi:hypothetical protein